MTKYYEISRDFKKDVLTNTVTSQVKVFVHNLSSTVELKRWARSTKENITYEYGIPGKGARNVALMILANATENYELALKLYPMFANEIIAKLDRNILIHYIEAYEVKTWIEFHLATQPLDELVPAEPDDHDKHSK